MQSLVEMAQLDRLTTIKTMLEEQNKRLDRMSNTSAELSKLIHSLRHNICEDDNLARDIDEFEKKTPKSIDDRDHIDQLYRRYLELAAKRIGSSVDVSAIQSIGERIMAAYNKFEDDFNII